MFFIIVIIFLLIFVIIMGVFAFSSVGYNEAKAYNVDGPLATRWKPLRGFGLALPVRDRLDDL